MPRVTHATAVAREARILELRLQGLTMEQVAREMGITTQTVSSYLRGVKDAPTLQDRLVERNRSRSLFEQMRVKKAVREYLAKTKGTVLMRDLAAHAGVSEAEVRPLLTAAQKKRMHKHEPGEKRRRLQGITDEELFAIASALAATGPVTSGRWDRERDRDQVPSAASLGYRFGGWLLFLEAAGQPLPELVRSELPRVWSREAMLDEVGRFLVRPHGDGLASTPAQWNSYAEGNPFAPALNTLTDRIGSWAEVKAQASARRREQPPPR